MSRTTDERTQFVGPWYIYLDWEDRADWRTKGSAVSLRKMDYTSSYERQYCMFRQEVL